MVHQGRRSAFPRSLLQWNTDEVCHLTEVAAEALAKPVAHVGSATRPSERSAENRGTTADSTPSRADRNATTLCPELDTALRQHASVGGDPVDRRSSASTAARERRGAVLATDLPINGMELAFQKGPLVFSVGRDFPRSGSFAIAERGTPLMIRVDKSGDATGSPGESVNVALRSQFSVALDLTPTGAARQFTFSHAASGVRETLFDLNADGIFDVRHTEDIECQHAGRVFVHIAAPGKRSVGPLNRTCTTSA